MYFEYHTLKQHSFCVASEAYLNKKEKKENLCVLWAPMSSPHSQICFTDLSPFASRSSLSRLFGHLYIQIVIFLCSLLSRIFCSL
ncbi:hypothetical protein L5515_005598 [Caenorhabditis briggsae]|uniref:Uncharacterized protein n=1 Tax=Caenorhabditis briggsae TaxID=6238 RepID=A0AAE9EKR1_CAEBR|nr:hypothetical protein L5515_005598 [Caenorhabditis briggsae]